MQAGIKHFAQVPGRMEKVSDPSQPAVFVDYAHTDDALRRVLQNLTDFKQGRLITLFGCGGDAKEIVFRVAGEGMDGGEDGAADGEGAGFVEDDGVEVCEALERFPALEEDAKLRTAAHGHGERGRNSETHSAGTGDDEHGDGVCQGEG